MKEKKNLNFFIAVSVLVGACIGAGVLGIPYVAAQSGFFVALVYIIVIGTILLFANLYLGEVSLRTKDDHQLIGYAEKYLGKRWKHVMEFAAIFGLYAALIAYMLGVGKSLSFLIFGNGAHELWIGIVFGIFMAVLIKGGLNSLRRFERIGVGVVLILLAGIFIFFIGKVEGANLLGFNPVNIFLPFGVILFALKGFYSIPETRLILKNNEKMFKKTMIISMVISVVFYILFALLVVGYRGMETPQIATLALGSVFVFLGIFTMLTSYLPAGNALVEDFIFDERMSNKWAWFFSAIFPIILFVLIHLTDFFSFTTILSIGGVVSGGTIAVLVLFMAKVAKQKGDRKPEYSLPLKWWFVVLISLLFILAVFREIVLYFR